VTAKRPRPSRVGVAALLTSSLLSNACATIGEEKVRTEVATQKAYERQVETERALVVTRQAGPTLNVHTSRECRRVATFDKRETTYFEDTNESSGGDYAALVFGLALGGVGSAMILDAHFGGRSDPNHMLFDKLDAKQELGVGIGTASAGGLLLLIPIIDGLRALGGREEVRDFQEDGPVVAPSEVCGFASKAPDAVAVNLAGLDAPLTLTMQNGQEVSRSMIRLSPSGQTPIDLVTMVPDALLRAARRPARLRVTIDSTTIAEVDPSPAYRLRDDAMWADLTRARLTCSQPLSIDACDDLSDYASHYPDSSYRAAALGLVTAAQPALIAMRDDVAFHQADPAGCRSPRAENACEGVRSYLASWPRGRHTGEAHLVLGEGMPRIALLVANREAEERAAERAQEDAAAREEAERRAAEENEAAEQRRAEQREAEEQRRAARREAANQRRERQRRPRGNPGGSSPPPSPAPANPTPEKTCFLWRNTGRGAGQGTRCSADKPFVRAERLGPCTCSN